MKNSELLQKLARHNQELLDFTNEMTALPEELLLARPTEKAWSATECFDHMNKATELYLDQVDQKLELLKPEKGDYKKTIFAGMFTKKLAPTEEGAIKSKMKTLKVFYPKKGVGTEAIDKFRSNLDRFKAVLTQAENKDLRSFKVTTALGPILKFYFGDALDFIHAHNRRHMQQIKNIIMTVESKQQNAA
ncbi:MAG: DinB family protein [Bacteroidota bacterium]